MWGLALVVLVAVTTAARADDRVVGVVVQGKAPLRGKLEDHITKQLRREGFTAADSPLSRDALNTIANCFIIEDLKCARGVVEARSKTPRVVFARVESTGSAVTLDLTWFSSGHDPRSEHKACDDCLDDWTTHADDLVRQLAGAAPTPIIKAPEPEPEPERQASRFWPTTLITVGAATFVAGGVFLYYGLRDGESHKYIYPQLTPLGISLLAVGGGAAIGGWFLLKPSSSSRSRPVAAVSPGGAYVGWVGAF